ncbi:toll-like receptor 4 [Mytilus californianus]|uniref:toll-like receptor 4 n=1 Tax=Mytilus californianus TaxID=6549 RepID=UPI0022454B9A|nr:toll-like receptor 4 [Mytilus californianus]
MEFFKRLTNLEIYDHSYFALGYRNPKFYNDTASRIDEIITPNSNSMPKKVILYAPKSLKEFRATHIMSKFLFDEVVFNESSLENFDVSDFDTIIFPKFTFIGKNRVKSLNISGISAHRTLDKFPLMSNLTTLRMSKAKLFRIFNESSSHIGIFNWAPNVEHLDLSKNFMWVLNKRFLDGLKHLKYLNLQGNLFQTVPEVVTSLTNINKIDLSFNLLPTLDENMRGWIDRQQKKLGKFEVFLVLNPFLCHCETVSFLYWIRSTNANLDCDGNYTCRLDANHVSHTLNVYEKIHDFYSDCNGILWLKFGVSLLTCISILTIFATLLYNFRWRLIFFCQRKFLKMAEKSLNVDFKYDVYVSYSDDGVSFIKNFLQPKIEQEWGLTLCCEDRDFFIGESIVDARAASIHESRHIIFLVTPSFRENEWSSFEIERAKYEKFSRDLQKIIVIAKGIATKDMPIEFATVWKDVSLIEWPIDVDGINMSCQKLRLSFFY